MKRVKFFKSYSGTDLEWDINHFAGEYEVEIISISFSTTNRGIIEYVALVFYKEINNYDEM